MTLLRSSVGNVIARRAAEVIGGRRRLRHMLVTVSLGRELTATHMLCETRSGGYHSDVAPYVQQPQNNETNERPN